MNYSPSHNSFYPEEYKQSYIDAGSLPSDLIDISAEKYKEIQDGVAAGKIYEPGANGFPELKDRPVELPSSCTPAQGLVALFALKQITEDDVQAAIDSIEDPVLKYTAQIAFKRAVTWDRNSQTMQTMAQLLSLSEKDLDDLFTYAVTIQA